MIGNLNAAKTLGACIKRNSAQSILVTGPPGVGKYFFIQSILQKVLQIGELAKQPDVHLVKIKEGQKNISIDQIRQALRKFSKKPILLDRMIMIIEDAHLLSEEASNALLVNLENPAVKNLIFLTSTTSAAVLPTIRSRCLPINLVTVNQEELKTGLERLYPNEQSIDRASLLAHGLPGRAIRLIEDKIWQKKLATISKDLELWSATGLNGRLSIAAKYGKDRERTQAFLREMAFIASADQKNGILIAERQIKNNVAPKTVLESLAMLK